MSDSTLERSGFGRTPAGEEIGLFTVTNARGLVLRVMDRGATVVSLEVPDREGRLANVTLGFPTLEGYLAAAPYFGATVGRFANRIAAARFALDGEVFPLVANEGENQLHGGPDGFDRARWEAEPSHGEDGAGWLFRHESPDGDQGFPGRLEATARYALGEDDTLVIELTATTDRPTPVNLTNHCFWNLRGAGGGTIREHRLELFADHFLPVDAARIPTGEIARVADTPMDFREPRAIGERLDAVAGDPPGYDHCYVLRGEAGVLRPAARVVEPETGRVMEIATTQPGIQLYSGNFLDGRDGHARWTGFCLETQHFPDSPNQPHFPSTILRPGETYRHTTVHRFAAG